jgi:hypothetical protein
MVAADVNPTTSAMCFKSRGETANRQDAFIPAASPCEAVGAESKKPITSNVSANR